jgi:drug/metabolite transporter (DMT)-like permease
MAAGRVTLQLSAISAAVLFVVTLALEERILPGSRRGWAALLALALISQVAGQGLVALALGRLPANFSSLVIFLEAIAAAALGWVILGEALSPFQYLGGLLIFGGIWFARPREDLRLS